MKKTQQVNNVSSVYIMDKREDMARLRDVLAGLRKNGKVLIALLYGSVSKGKAHKRSDIDLALYIKAKDEKEEMDIVDTILMSAETQISILRLNDEGESPFVVQEALKGIHLIEPDNDILFMVSHRALHETESIRFSRGLNAKR